MNKRGSHNPVYIHVVLCGRHSLYFIVLIVGVLVNDPSTYLLDIDTGIPA